MGFSRGSEGCRKGTPAHSGSLPPCRQPRRQAGRGSRHAVPRGEGPSRRRGGVAAGERSAREAGRGPGRSGARRPKGRPEARGRRGPKGLRGRSARSGTERRIKACAFRARTRSLFPAPPPRPASGRLAAPRLGRASAERGRVGKKGRELIQHWEGRQCDGGEEMREERRGKSETGRVSKWEVQKSRAKHLCGIPKGMCSLLKSGRRGLFPEVILTDGALSRESAKYET